MNSSEMLLDERRKAYNNKLALLLEAEYRRRLARYSLTDQQLGQKYQMSFDEFERQRITEQCGYTWEAESDAMAWETAVDGVRTVRGQLNDLLGRDHLPGEARATTDAIHGRGAGDSGRTRSDLIITATPNDSEIRGRGAQHRASYPRH